MKTLKPLSENVEFRTCSWSPNHSSKEVSKLFQLEEDKLAEHVKSLGWTKYVITNAPDGEYGALFMAVKLI